MNRISFRVFEKGTNKDVTEEREWLIDKFGYINYLDKNYPDCPVQCMIGFYYYKITIWDDGIKKQRNKKITT